MDHENRATKPIAEVVAKLQRQVKALARSQAGRSGIERGRLYRKSEFLDAAKISERTWRNWLKRPGFSALVRRMNAQGTECAFILGDDFIEWSKSLCAGSGSNSSSQAGAHST